ncbi:uncharacterized protein BO96DRAFT_431483 [Aspergillus niger CBS 101883]|uniref:uncharacterized protein n=1 Tax=Aspergillus lacticoffeatus (strain CBS 101883) TaxID=1450533 RepID=UPI000D803864|nr:uncharacterized protein BO96DRAFT_431483 [Aspergillus niger CBS 101883]PYH59324.1 hypothetical protein BO96DRAFT_431483 [Aspergillus niger CBS 101883]
MKRDDVAAYDADSSAETQRNFDRRITSLSLKQRKDNWLLLSTVLEERRNSTSPTGDFRRAHRPASNNFTGVKSRPGDPVWRLDTGLITCIAGSISTRTRPRRCACGLGNCSGKGIVACRKRVWMRLFVISPPSLFFLGTCQCAHHLHVAARPVRGDFVDPSFSYRLIAGRCQKKDWPGTHDVSSSREEYPSKGVEKKYYWEDFERAKGAAATTATAAAAAAKPKQLYSPIRAKRKQPSHK